MQSMLRKKKVILFSIKIKIIFYVFIQKIHHFKISIFSFLPVDMMCVGTTIMDISIVMMCFCMLYIYVYV